jgi:hypothetical protein
VTAPHPAPSEDSCSRRSALAAEPLAGTAPERHTWLAIEQPGPWGHDAWRASHLPDGLPATFPEEAAQNGIGVLLIRRPGRHADTHRAGPRTILLATVTPLGRSLRRYVVNSDELAERVSALDVTSRGLAASQSLGSPLAPTDDGQPDPCVLVCTHARRDTCCALSGRGLADLLRHTSQSNGSPIDLWECSHLGGHRFAPTALVLPSGLMLGRATVDDVVDALAGRVPLRATRGHTWRSAHAQVAEATARSASREVATELRITSTFVGPEGAQHLVETAEGHSWRVRTWGVDRPPEAASCGAAPQPGRSISGEVIPAS